MIFHAACFIIIFFQHHIAEKERKHRKFCELGSVGIGAVTHGEGTFTSSFFSIHYHGSSLARRLQPFFQYGCLGNHPHHYGANYQ